MPFPLQLLQSIWFNSLESSYLTTWKVDVGAVWWFIKIVSTVGITVWSRSFSLCRSSLMLRLFEKIGIYNSVLYFLVCFLRNASYILFCEFWKVFMNFSILKFCLNVISVKVTRLFINHLQPSTLVNSTNRTHEWDNTHNIFYKFKIIIILSSYFDK